MTLIVLLILAGVSLSAVFSEKGIFSRAEKAGNKYNEAKAREVLETVLLADGQYEKHSNPKYNQDDFLNELITKEIEGAEVKGDIAIIDGWAFLLDRSVPKIGEPLGRADSLIFPTVKVSEAKLAEDYRTASFTVTAIEATNGIKKIEIWLNGEKIKDLDKTYSNVKEEIEQEFTVNKNGVYTVKVYGKLMESETVEVTGIVPAVTFLPNGNSTYEKQHSTTITVEKTAETITEMKYLWTTSQNPPEISAFNDAEPCTDNSTITGGNETMTGTYYLWILLTTEAGSTRCGSEGFNFDNKGPNITALTPTKYSETGITLSVTAQDLESGIANFEFYIDDEDKPRETEICDITRESVTINKTITGLSTGNHTCKVIVYDAKNNHSSETTSGSTKLYAWSKWNCEQKDNWQRVEGEIQGPKEFHFASGGMPYRYATGPNENGKFSLTQAYSTIDKFSSGYLNPSGIGGQHDEKDMYDAVLKLVSRTDSNGEYYSFQDWTYRRIYAENNPTYSCGNISYGNVTSTLPNKYKSGERNSDGYWYISISPQ